jgi:hypothetical protein
MVIGGPRGSEVSMTRKKTPKPINMIAAQAAANKYVMEYIGSKPFGLSGLSEEDFKAVMDSIVKAMMNAWADGYMKRNDEG